MFNCIARIGWLNRMTQFKEKAGKDRENASVGLYAYPCLMAADILAYRATHVPVGEDQKQHLELDARHRAEVQQRFRQAHRGTRPRRCVLPADRALISGPAMRVMSLRDGTKKMSKSDPSDYSRINLTDDADTIAQKIQEGEDRPAAAFRATRRSSSSGQRRRIWSAFIRRSPAKPRRRCSSNSAAPSSPASRTPSPNLRSRSSGPIDAEMKRLVQDTAHIDAILADGSARARAIAAETMKAVKDICGFVRA